MANSPSQSEADIKRWTKRRFGFGVVDVELTDDSLDDAIDSAKRWFSSYVGQEAIALLTVPPSGGEVDVPDDVETVTEVVFENRNQNFINIFDWADVELSPIGYGAYYGSPSGSYSYLVQAQQYIEQGQKIISADRDWEWVRPTRKLRLFPTNETGGRGIGNKAVIRYLRNTVDLAELYQYEYDLVRRYSYAEAMETLGYIRTKFASLPSASGEVTLNGDLLVSNAEGIKLALSEEIKLKRRPAGFFAW